MGKKIEYVDDKDVIIEPNDEIENTNDETEPEEIDYKSKCELLQNNLHLAYEKIRYLEKQLSDREIKERSTDMLISQAVSVFSNTVTLAIKNKNN